MPNLPYKIDKTSFSSQYGAYQNYQTWKIPVTISGSIPNGKYNLYQAAFGFSQDNARGRAFLQRSDGSIRTQLNVGFRLSTFLPNYTVYQYASSETVQTSVYYGSGGDTFVVALAILNQTGVTVNLTTQVVDIIVEFYDGPVE